MTLRIESFFEYKEQTSANSKCLEKTNLQKQLNILKLFIYFWKGECFEDSEENRLIQWHIRIIFRISFTFFLQKWFFRMKHCHKTIVCHQILIIELIFKNIKFKWNCLMFLERNIFACFQTQRKVKEETVY